MSALEAQGLIDHLETELERLEGSGREFDVRVVQVLHTALSNLVAAESAPGPVGPPQTLGNGAETPATVSSTRDTFPPIV